MSVTGDTNATVTIRCDAGFVATKYRIVDADTKTNVAIGPVTTGITTTGTLLYKASAKMPATPGDYVIQWDDGSGAWNGSEDLTVGLAATEVDPTLVDLSRKFPPSAVVGAYPITAGPVNGEGAPVGSPTTTGTVSSAGTVSFIGLKTGIDYFIGAIVSAKWTWVRYHA